jgi:hypothetical protein
MKILTYAIIYGVVCIASLAVANGPFIALPYIMAGLSGFLSYTYFKMWKELR